MRRNLTLLIAALTMLATGCTKETRHSWENCRQHRHLVGVEGPADPAQPGTALVIYPDRKPVQTFGAPGYPEQITTRFEHGVHINVYDGPGPDALLISHRWQRSQQLKP